MSVRKMSIQAIAEKLLKKHEIDPESDSYYLKLKKKAYMDLVIEKQGPDVFIGHYYKQYGDLISDPVLAMDYNDGMWYPVRIEQVFGDTICSYIKDGCRMISKSRIKDFRSFQTMFARNIRDQGWLDVVECHKEA